ncbi:MAG: hypothetical protein SNJ64_06845, partial [Endomicrobiia bacterium]
YLSIVSLADIGLNRNFGQQLGQSYQNEELQNALMRQQAAMQNSDINFREQMYNNQLQNQHDLMVRNMQNAGISQIGQGITGALTSKFQSEKDANYLQMLNPNYYFVQEGNFLNRRIKMKPRR